MNFEKLLREGKIERVERENYDDKLALKDIETAEHNLHNGYYDWALTIAYNAVLRVSRSFMFFLGYRPIGKNHHKNVFDFLRECNFDEDLVDYFDYIRKRRNKFLYNMIDSTTKQTAQETITKAKLFVQKIRTFVQKIRTQD